MSRKARTHSSLALALVVFVVAALWFASRQLASAGETPLRGGDKIGDSIVDASAAKAKATKAVVFPLPTDFKVKLLGAGLTPRALAAAGLSLGSILPALQAAADQMNGAPLAIGERRIKLRDRAGCGRCSGAQDPVGQGDPGRDRELSGREARARNGRARRVRLSWTATFRPQSRT